MGSADETIVFHKLLKDYWYKVFHIHTGIQCLLHLM